MTAILLITIATATEECQRVQDISKIPCTVYSSWKPANCTQPVIITGEKTNITINATWQEGTPSCQFTFNQTGKQTYCYNSTIETGCITVSVTNLQIGIVIGLGIIIAVLMFLAFKLDDSKDLNQVLKLVLIIICVSLMLLIPATFVVDDISKTFYSAIIWIVRIFWVGMGIFLAYYFYQKMTNHVVQR